MNWWVINSILIIIILAFVGYDVYLKIMAKKSAKVIDQEEFTAGMRKAQVIDVREKDYFDAGHILGARNFPYITLKQSYTGLRKDIPIYIYDQKKSLSIRTANYLRKQGYTELYILKGGYAKWSGKIKKK